MIDESRRRKMRRKVWTLTCQTDASPPTGCGLYSTGSHHVQLRKSSPIWNPSKNKSPFLNKTKEISCFLSPCQVKHCVFPWTNIVLSFDCMMSLVRQTADRGAVEGHHFKTAAVRGDSSSFSRSWRQHRLLHFHQRTRRRALPMTQRPHASLSVWLLSHLLAPPTSSWQTDSELITDTVLSGCY